MSTMAERLRRLHTAGHAHDAELRDESGVFTSGDYRPAAVLAAITERERPGFLFIHRPSTMRAHPGQVAFPGGKIDPGESAEECLLRELREELRILVRLEQQLPVSTHHYPSVTVTLHPFVCTMATGHPNPQEHDTVAWFSPEELRTLDWAAADVPVLAAYLATRRKDAP